MKFLKQWLNAVVDSWKSLDFGLVKFPEESVEDASEKGSNLNSFSYKDIVDTWIRIQFPTEAVIVLSNVNLNAKNLQFWARVPKESVPHFLKDIVILKCKDRTQVLTLMANIESSFAEAAGYYSGFCIGTNEEKPE